MTENPITLYRKSRGLTLEQLGGALGIGRSTLFKWENRRVPAERVIDVERLTGIPRHELRPDIFGPAPVSRKPRSPEPANGEAA